MALWLIAGLFVAAILALAATAVSSLKRQIGLLEARITALQTMLDSEPGLPLVAISPLRGMRVRLAIEQDHKLPVLEGLLEQELLNRDISGLVNAEGNQSDITISGSMTCNGYSDTYFAADLVATKGGESVYKVITRPPNGDRPSNLAKEFVLGLEQELEKRSRQRERQQAINELES